MSLRNHAENKGVGERGRNRTFNLLTSHQQPKTKGFNDFPAVFFATVGSFGHGCHDICYEVVNVEFQDQCSRLERSRP